MKYLAELKSLPGGIAFSCRTKIQEYQCVGSLWQEIGPEIAGANPGLKCVEPDYCFTIYHDDKRKHGDIDVELCQLVVAEGNPTERVKFKKMDSVPEAVCVKHKGPYETIPEAYQFAYDWVAQNGYVPTQPSRESYIDGPWNKENPEDWLTEVQIPVMKK
ncbi:MAG: GyrI-like domain-containing protein [Candidatus Sumerlaeales bacterium]|nr:GyrI-like domain-containing protein [Candidatus Sumerlaeales bacterium]